jgi:phosphoenolpyruvate synthase/pyruvate phosphate dikinase
MSGFIKHFSEISRNDIDEVGGKGANLGELVCKGFPVPPGFVISAEAYAHVFQTIKRSHELDNFKNVPLDEHERHCSTIRSQIIQSDISQELADAIRAAHHQLVQQRGSPIVCAVRSSATAEDLQAASFAGQHDTYYYVAERDLLPMIKYCWASLWNPEAVSYREARGVEHAQVLMAVVVQEMIQAEVSGIVFTANPVTGARNELIIEASWGMGAAIVDGRVTPDRYIIERNGLTLREKRIAEKRVMVPACLKEAGRGRLEEVPHGMRQRETLAPDLLKTVAEWAVKSEEHFGSPQDVEWAITDGQVYILQSRPITIMGRTEIGGEVQGQYVLFKPAVENLTEPLTPVTADVLAMFFAPAIQFIRGWAYLNLKCVRPMLPFKLSDADLVNLLYSGSATHIPVTRLALLKLPLLLLAGIYAYFTFGVVFARTRNMPDGFMESFRKLCRMVAENPSCGPVETICRLWFLPKLFDPIGNMPLFVNFSAAQYIMLIALLKMLVRCWIPDLRADAETLLCSGLEGVLSAEMGHDIWALASEANRHQRVRELFLEYPPEQVLSKLRTEPETKEFLVRLQRFWAKNGHRALKELELQSVRWEENPTQVMGMIRNYLLVESERVEPGQKLTQSRIELEAEIRRKLEKYPFERPLRLRWRLIRWLAQQAKYFAKLRENSRFYHIGAFYILRKKLLKIETELLDQGKLKCQGDIFFLKLHEIASLQTGQLGWSDVEDLIHKRRLEHVRCSKMTPPKTIGFNVPEKSGQDDVSGADGMILRGQSASPGSYEGIAHVILDPSIDAELKPGEILVAPYTDPAWTPLFLTAGAAVVEVGSYLSHAGTIAREYGMPCVVDVAECTKRIQTGVRLNVDGDRGIVRILS